MLHRLSIRNYAIIDKLDVEFSDRLNIITGETGAGKSILLGALNLILGERVDTRVLHNQEEKCVVEAVFEIQNENLKTFFTAREVDFDTHTIVRREINQSGKSRAFINDTPVTLQVLKELGEQLVNLHSQHETLELTKAGFQLYVIDTLAGNQQLLGSYKLLFADYKRAHQKFTELIEQIKLSNADLDYMQFQLNELAETRLIAGEQTALEAEQNNLSNVEEIKRVLSSAVQILKDGEVSMLDQLNEVQLQLKNVKNYNQGIFNLTERLRGVSEEMKDIANELETIQERTELDPERLDEVAARLNTIYRLQKKHNTTNVKDLLAIQSMLEQKIATIDNNTSQIEMLKAELDIQIKALIKLADELHTEREKILHEFQTNVMMLLAKVGMHNSTFKVDIRKTEPHYLSETGLTDIKFLFSANKGFPAQEIKEVASGGELSRLMLCIKSLIADAGALPTMIFDEIDSGVSGEVALKVGEIMKKLSRQHQLIAITHLPQIARAGDTHLYIYKQNTELRTRTLVKELKGEERVIEIAKMLGGDKVSDASLANARELIAS